MQDELYAFWPYDLFPYYLGGRVVKMSGESVEIKGYGPGYLFKPPRLVEGKAGRKILADLQALKDEHRKALNVVATEFRSKLNDLGFK